MNRKDRFNIAVALSCILQGGLNVLVPILLCGILAKFLIDRLSLPDITMVVAIVIGTLSGVYNMFKYIYSVINRKR